MRKKFIWLLASCLMALSLVLVSCGTKTTPTTTSTIAPTSIPTSTVTIKPTTTTTSKPTQAAGIPQYGGTFTYRSNVDSNYWDPSSQFGAGNMNLGEALFYEGLGQPDWTVDLKVWDFKTSFIPLKYQKGRLAESWEQPDATTIIFHIRKGVKWQDKAPVNGRELTAYDIEYTYHRLYGLGSGFTKGSPFIDKGLYEFVKSVTATDKYTLVVKLTQPSLSQFTGLLGLAYNQVHPKEAVDKWGDLQHWTRMIGTGPYTLDDYVSGQSATLNRNPSYWGYDELYPKNQLPYIDTVKILIIPDNSTALAAVRTGKIDLIENINGQQAMVIQNSNPDLLDTPPFTDIKVRKAMQMAIDIPTIAKTYYGGYSTNVPMGLSGLQGHFTPFDKWPEEVKYSYTYNPEGAKKLLAEAGYPSGFKFTLTASNTNDMDLAQIAQSYFKAVGITMEIQVFDSVTFGAYTRQDKHTTMWQYSTFRNYPPLPMMNQHYSVSYPFRHHLKDAYFDDLWLQVKSATTDEQTVELILKADAYATANQWTIKFPAPDIFCFYWPWLKRFNGEVGGTHGTMNIVSRMWIDANLKKSVGH
jgi:peptide/nickel transport system substrate-binding protein